MSRAAKRRNCRTFEPPAFGGEGQPIYCGKIEGVGRRLCHPVWRAARNGAAQRCCSRISIISRFAANRSSTGAPGGVGVGSQPIAAFASGQARWRIIVFMKMEVSNTLTPAKACAMIGRTSMPPRTTRCRGRPTVAASAASQVACCSLRPAPPDPVVNS